MSDINDSLMLLPFSSRKCFWFSMLSAMNVLSSSICFNKSWLLVAILSCCFYIKTTTLSWQFSISCFNMSSRDVWSFWIYLVILLLWMRLKVPDVWYPSSFRKRKSETTLVVFQFHHRTSQRVLTSSCSLLEAQRGAHWFSDSTPEPSRIPTFLSYQNCTFALLVDRCHFIANKYRREK